MRRIATLALVTAAAVATAAVALATPSPRAVRASIVAAALAQTSVHWTHSYANLDGETRTADVSAGLAREHVTFNNFGVLGRVEILRIGHIEYEKGGVRGLEDDLGLTDAQAAQYAGQWISIPKGDKSYGVYGLTLTSVVHDAILRGRLNVVRRKSRGTSLLVVKGRGAGQWAFSSTLSAHAGSRLPVSYSGGAVDVWIDDSFSKWNEPLSVHAPASSTPIATVRG